MEVAIPEDLTDEQAPVIQRVTSNAPDGILVSSAAAKVPLVRAVREAAERMHRDFRIVGGDQNPASVSRYFTDDFWQMPSTIDENLSEILRYCRAAGIRIVIPTRDGELAFWSRHRGTFADAGVTVLVSSPEAVGRCLDKMEFATFGHEHGLPVIATTITLDDPDFDDVRRTTDAYVIKERYGAGSVTVGLNLSQTAALDHALTLDQPVFQPFITGREISVDAYVDRGGRVHGLMPRTRDLVEHGESQVTTTFEDPDLVARLAGAIERLGLYGPLVLQALLTDDGGLHIIECNCRFGGASTLGIAAGVDSFFWFLQESIGADLSAYPFRPVSRPLRQVRAASDDIEEVSG